MAPLNQYQIGISRQAARGTAATAMQYVFDVTASDVGPTIDTTTREETGQGRDQGDPVVTRIAASGSFTVLARPSLLGLLYFGALGANATTGTGPYVHTPTAANTQPYFTLWTMMFSGAVGINVRIQDVKLTGLNLTGEAGGDLSAQCGIVGGRWVEATPPALGTYVSDLPLRVPGAVYEKDGSVTNAISQFGVNLQADVNTQQTDRIYDSYFEEGGRSCEVTFTQVYETLADWRKVHLGRTTIGDGSPSGAVYYEPLDLTFADEQGTVGLAINIPRFGYMTAPLAPNTNAEMAMQQVTGRAARPMSGGLYTGASVVAPSITNSVASYPNAA